MKPLTPTAPHVIIMVGIPGAGKTHFAEQFAKTFSAPFIDINKIQALSGFSDKRAAELSSYLLGELLKTKQTIVFEGPTHLRTYRDALTRKVRAHGYEPMIVWVQTETATALSRASKGQPDAVKQQHEMRLTKFSPPHIREGGVVISGRHTYGTQVKVVLKRLAGERKPTAVQESPSSSPNPRRGRSIRIS